MDEFFIKINGNCQYLWRAVGRDGDVVNIPVQSWRDKLAALRFFRKMLKSQGTPRKIETDKLRSYGAARQEAMSLVLHCQDQYANNRAEASHRHTRRQERKMRRFKSHGQAQRFPSVHSQLHNLFNVGRHLLKARHYRMFRALSFDTWLQVTRAC